MKFFSFFSTSLSVSLLAVLTGCGGSNPLDPPPSGSISNFRPIDNTSEPKLVICKDWSWNADKNEITFTESADCQMGKELHLGFKEDLILEQLGSPNIEIKSPFAAMEIKEGVYANMLSVNGAPYTGRIKGYNVETSQQVLDVRFLKGDREGIFTVWSSTGRAHERNFMGEVTQSPQNAAKRKPIIYLYPTETTKLHVALNFDGELTTTYPKYNANTGWNVTAQKDGTLHDEKGKEYYALYWEGECDYQYDLSTGFVVRGTETAAFLEDKLAVLGLNRREANEFINFWLPILEHEPYNLIHFAGADYTNRAVLNITPKPETEIRVMMIYQPLKAPVAIKAQELKKVTRKGFTVVEWGGMEQTDLPELVK